MNRDGVDVKIMGEGNYSKLKIGSKIKINECSLETTVEQVGGNIDLNTECHRGSRVHTAQLQEADRIGVSINGAIYRLV